MRWMMLMLMLWPALVPAQVSLQRVEPPFWWTGFKNPDLQLLVYGKEIGSTTVSLKYPGVSLKQVHTAESLNYLFLDLVLAPNTKPGNFKIIFKKDKKQVAEYTYELKPRAPGSAGRKGFDASDVIYLIVPDRFANGDVTNDSMPGMVQGIHRQDPGGRHGGDLRGVADHLGYIQELGATAIWMTPFLENNMEVYSYHGYSITDYYHADPRLGTNAQYVALADSLHGRGMKIIMDMVFNHCGSEHWWMKDLPWQDWINQWPELTKTSYRAGTTVDPYVSAYDSIKFLKGWFDKTMPDLNQHNPFLANYLIQNSIWWIEYAGLDGIRQDTHPYSFRDFLADWGKAVLTEYPNFNMVGECWFTIPASVASWQKDALNRDGYNSYLPSVFDFPMYDALRLGFMEEDGWNTGILRLYEVLQQDFSYPDPMHIVVLADNHDVNRYLDSQGDDVRKMKMGLAFVLTSRGIPEVYYGSEILMTTGKDKGDGMKRKDFPGGWPSDSLNAFTSAGRTPEQNDMYNYLHTLLNWRKGKEVIHSGKLRQFIPQQSVYVYFRYNATDTVMVVMNNHPTETKTLDKPIYQEFLHHSAQGTEVITGEKITDFSQLTMEPKSVKIIELSFPH